MSFLRRRADPHARPRELLAARLDRPLNRLETKQLARHLSQCVLCQAVEREYRAARVGLRSLSQRPPPRDLWARTSAALDIETARHSPRIRREPVRLAPVRLAPGPRAAVVLSAAIAGLALALAVYQLPPAPSDESARQPTPFVIPTSALAFVGVTDAGFAVYRANVTSVCPAQAIDCEPANAQFTPAVFRLPNGVRPNNVAISPQFKSMAIVGRGLNAAWDTVAVLPMSDDLWLAPASPNPSLSISPRPYPTATTRPELIAVAILDDVIITGAPPAWSADGATLAFSAMPADDSHGPDIWVWHPGEGLAAALTDEHDTYFASWAGDQIVANRVSATDSDGVDYSVVVIDPGSGDQTPVTDLPLWLPAIDPSGSAAIGWYGQLGWSGARVTPLTGTLAVGSWSYGQPDPSPVADASESPTASALPDATEEPSASAAPDATDDADASPSTQPTLVLPDGLLAADPTRDALRSPTLDWLVRWSDDGGAAAWWIADTPGSAWGQLTVTSFDTVSGALRSDTPVLATFARRGFTLGNGRIAFVEPGEGSPFGVLNVRTWGIEGAGVLRFTRQHITDLTLPF